MMRTASSACSGEMFLNFVQVKLADASIRPGQSQEWLLRAEQRVLESVNASSAEIVCHCGTWSASLQLHRLSRYACYYTLCEMMCVAYSGEGPVHCQAMQSLCKHASSSQGNESKWHAKCREHDLEQAKLLPLDKCNLKVHYVDSHRLAITLNRENKLLPAIRTAMLKEMGLYRAPRLANLL